MYAQEELYNKASKAYFKLYFLCTCRLSGAKVQLFAYNKFGQKINSASHV
jgi:hypothetical protein